MTSRRTEGGRGDRAPARNSETARAETRESAAQPRTNAYFLPGAGISREVIQADICRYLGNDALVKPGSQQDPTTGRTTTGFIINAYRDLTSHMIADLKADSARWEQDAARERVPYRESVIHQSRQYYGPTPAPTYETPQTYQPSSATPYDTTGTSSTPGYIYTSQPGAYTASGQNTYQAGGNYIAQGQPGEAPRFYQAPTQAVPDNRYQPGYPQPQGQAAPPEAYPGVYARHPQYEGRAPGPDPDPRDPYYNQRERRE